MKVQFTQAQKDRMSRMHDKAWKAWHSGIVAYVWDRGPNTEINALTGYCHIFLRKGLAPRDGDASLWQIALPKKRREKGEQFKYTEDSLEYRWMKVVLECEYYSDVFRYDTIEGAAKRGIYINLDADDAVAFSGLVLLRRPLEYANKCKLTLQIMQEFDIPLHCAAWFGECITCTGKNSYEFRFMDGNHSWYPVSHGTRSSLLKFMRGEHPVMHRQLKEGYTNCLSKLGGYDLHNVPSATNTLEGFFPAKDVTRKVRSAWGGVYNTVHEYSWDAMREFVHNILTEAGVPHTYQDNRLKEAA